MTDSPASSSGPVATAPKDPPPSKLASVAFYLGIATLVFAVIAGAAMLWVAYADHGSGPGGPMGGVLGDIFVGMYFVGIVGVPVGALLSLVMGLVAFMRGRAKTAHPATKKRGLVGALTGVGGFLIGAASFVLFLMKALEGLHGRALRIAGKPTTAKPTSRGDWTSRGVAVDAAACAELDVEARSTLARRWLDAAVHEHAAVPAFGLLAIDLVQHGAGPDLVARANRAALEEIEHARDAFAIASVFAGERLGPSAIPSLQDARSAGDLGELAVASLVDGCVGEGIGAALVSAAAKEARDPTLRALLERTASEEQSHAELAWDVLDFALEQGGDPVAASVHAALARLDDLVVDDRLADDAILPCGYGFVTRAQRAELTRAVVTATRRRLQQRELVTLRAA